jgi:hypothetical protein
VKALFGRKISNIEELREATFYSKKEGSTGSSYVVTKEVKLTNDKFKILTDNLLADQPWISKEDGGPNKDGELKCIRVINLLTGEKLLINSEGYDFPRYTALED